MSLRINFLGSVSITGQWKFTWPGRGKRAAAPQPSSKRRAHGTTAWRSIVAGLIAASLVASSTSAQLLVIPRIAIEPAPRVAPPAEIGGRGTEHSPLAAGRGFFAPGQAPTNFDEWSDFARSTYTAEELSRARECILGALRNTTSGECEPDTRFMRMGESLPLTLDPVTPAALEDVASGSWESSSLASVVRSYCSGDNKAASALRNGLMVNLGRYRQSVAEDAAHDALTTILEKVCPSLFFDHIDLSQKIGAIAANAARRNARLSRMHYSIDGLNIEVVAPDSGPFEQMQASFAVSALRKKLDDDHIKVLGLYEDGFTSIEIGRILRMSPEKARRYMSEARGTLKEYSRAE